MFISDKELVNKSNSIGCFYNSVNTVLDEFINYIKNGSDEFFKNYQKSEIKFLKGELKKLKGHFVNLGDAKTIKEEKTRFVELIKSTLNVHFSALNKKTLLMLIDCFYEVQQVEYKDPVINSV